MSGWLIKLYFHGVFNPSLHRNLYLSAMLREGDQQGKLNDWFVEFTKNNFHYYIENNTKVNEGPLKKDLLYTSTLNLDNDRFRAVYNQNYSAWGHAFRWISALPLALWDVVCSITRIALYLLVNSHEADVYSLGYNWMQFYHIGKNFEIAWGRIRGMVNDAKGVEIVHRAYVDKRIYCMAWDQRPGQMNRSRNFVLGDFCIECVWNVVQQKGLKEEEQFSFADHWIGELNKFISGEDDASYYDDHIDQVDQALKNHDLLRVKIISDVLSKDRSGINGEDLLQLLNALEKGYNRYLSHIEILLKNLEKVNLNRLRKNICSFVGLDNSCKNVEIKNRFKKIIRMIHPDHIQTEVIKPKAGEVLNKVNIAREAFEKWFPKDVLASTKELETPPQESFRPVVLSLTI